jgi:hypothetical protein
MTPELIVAAWIWIVSLYVAYRYMEHLFTDLRFAWSRGNRVGCLVLCLAGPAALVCAFAVDYSRPLAA